MKSSRPYPRATITPKGERAIVAGHPWVYEAEVVSLEESDAPDALPLTNGCLVDVLSRKGAYLGTGLLSESSKIRLRLITRNANDRFDQAFWERKVRWSWEYRKSVMGADVSCCRVVFGEADGFPGLVVDRFNDVLVTQTLTFGMEQLKPVVFPVLAKVLSEDGVALRGIYERNDVATRKLETLDQSCGWFDLGGVSAGGDTTTEICENGVRYQVDFENGQKTGFFLDQKYNRRAVAALASGKRVLDCFTHTGSFALNAAVGGAEFVNAVDVSQLAIDQARANARLNGCEDRMAFTCTNVFDLLPQMEEDRDHSYDFIILDPPAFTKSRKTIGSASRGYKEINYRAMKLLPRGGYLATASCSHFMDTERFRRMLVEAAHDAGVQLKQVEERQQAPDHPILWGVPETDYLKFFIFQVV
ncbi:Ribosomal RNA large subunit methyltransferase I [Slackia heliotrinireducens]|uniref:SAM-dependent methyltransferase n=1 Tax=Slackia heliotrinireducens (strain ATCC 29202 / DSM 20476 / NCTC 11029 / RHS 1) TaxID=471855 RepID=C7N186_SLAHD|nr:class I SAM-dependent rRNA methyltransferase [Slackia heliotrinireducens]ACV23308.1 SAM-dependent methyltransferase [Slackia heliotrinireducens DSM 20476]VEH02501.1 Ribosomal RNA large subunit methyltransferase I [Slackia heliotrinireducens]